MDKSTAPPASKASAPQEIADFLAAQIRSGDLPPGARLPTEHALAERFEVSRPVVREAISRVKADGLVHSRQGSGLYVASPLDRRSFKVEVSPGEDFAVALKLFELRLPIEMAAARLSAARRTDEDLALMEAAHRDMEERDGDVEGQVAADLRFHHAIATATRNSYYVELMAYLGGVLHEGMRFARSKSGTRVRGLTIEEHARILRAIRERNPELAALAVLTHIENARERMMTGRTAES